MDLLEFLGRVVYIRPENTRRETGLEIQMGHCKNVFIIFLLEGCDRKVTRTMKSRRSLKSFAGE